MSADRAAAVQRLADMALEAAKLEKRVRHARDHDPMPWEHRQWLNGCAGELSTTRRTLLKIVFEHEPALTEPAREQLRLTRLAIVGLGEGSDAKREHDEWKDRNDGS